MTKGGVGLRSTPEAISHWCSSSSTAAAAAHIAAIEQSVSICVAFSAITTTHTFAFVVDVDIAHGFRVKPAGWV